MTAVSDPVAKKAISLGVPDTFVDAAKKLSAADKEKTSRAGVESRGTKEIPAGSDNITGTPHTKPGEDPIWGNISENEVASAYKR